MQMQMQIEVVHNEASEAKQQAVTAKQEAANARQEAAAARQELAAVQQKAAAQQEAAAQAQVVEAVVVEAAIDAPGNHRTDTASSYDSGDDAAAGDVRKRKRARVLPAPEAPEMKQDRVEAGRLAAADYEYPELQPLLLPPEKVALHSRLPGAIVRNPGQGKSKHWGTCWVVERKPKYKSAAGEVHSPKAFPIMTHLVRHYCVDDVLLSTCNTGSRSSSVSTR